MSEEQPRLFDYSAHGEAAGEFIVSDSNTRAVDLVRRWRDWTGGAVALFGPPGSGKSHLLRSWAEEAGAGQLNPNAAAAEVRAAFAAHNGRLAVDGLDGPHDDAAIMLLLDLARSEGGAILAAGQTPPAEWPAGLPDLRSRFSSLVAIGLEDPDQELLQAVIRRLCRRRFIELRENVAKYIAEHSERSFTAAQELVDELDRMMISGRRPVAYDLASEALKRVARRHGVDDPA